MKKVWGVLILMLLVGCKSQQTVQERVVTKVDSTAVFSLQSELQVVKAENIQLKTSLERSRQENTKLSNEIESHTIDYDTKGEVDKETGKYPIASETITTSKSVLEKAIKEQEVLLKEYKGEVTTLQRKNDNLNYQIETLKDENKELKNKTTKDGFSFKWFLLK